MVSKDDEQRLLLAVQHIARAMDQYSHHLKLKHDMTLPQLQCLAILDSAGLMSLKALSAALNLSPSTVVGIVDRLQAKKWLSRKTAKVDKRGVRIALTSLGKTVLESAHNLIRPPFMDMFMAQAGSDRAVMLLGLEKVVDLLQQEQPNTADTVAFSVEKFANDILAL